MAGAAMTSPSGLADPRMHLKIEVGAIIGSA